MWHEKCVENMYAASSFRYWRKRVNERDSIRSIKGIGEKTQALFGKLGIETIGDLLRYYPRDYDEYKAPIAVTEIKEGEKIYERSANKDK